MGYYTYFTLEVKGVRSKIEANRLCDCLNDMGIVPDVLNEDFHYDQKHSHVFFFSDDSAKWYDSDEDMKKVSRQFPGMTFMLHGDGEDSGDLWEAYFHDGQVEYCRAEIPPPVNIAW